MELTIFFLDGTIAKFENVSQIHDLPDRLTFKHHSDRPEKAYFNAKNIAGYTCTEGSEFVG
jgi:hypothetical protein